MRPRTERHSGNLRIAILVRKLTFAGGSYKYAAKVARRMVDLGAGEGYLSGLLSEKIKRREAMADFIP